MAEGLIQVPPDSTGKKIRTVTGMAQGTDSTTHQEVHTVAGPDGYQAQVSSLGRLEVNTTQNAVVSAGNSSTANLGAGATFTGTGESTLLVNAVQVVVFASQQVTVEVQQSIDNTNWDVVESYVVPASTGDGRAFQATGSFVRVRVTNNGGSTTTAFRLQTVLLPFGSVLPGELWTPNTAQSVVATAVAVQSNAIQRRTYTASRTTAELGAPTGVTIVANSRKALFQVHHLASATTTKRIRRITVGALAGAAVQYGYEIYRVTAAPTGGTAVTPTPAESTDPASTLVCNYLPTSSGAISGVPFGGMVVAGTTTGHPERMPYDWKQTGETKPLVIRAGILEGFCLFVRGTGTVGPDPQIYIEYTEEG